MESQESEAKFDEPIQVVRAPRARWRVIVRRVLKYLTLAFLFLASCVTIVAWSVNTKNEHSITAKYGGSHVLLLASRNSQAWFGQFSCTVAGLPSVEFPTGIEFHSEEKNTVLIEKVGPPLTRLGVGVVYKMEFFERAKVNRLRDWLQIIISCNWALLHRS